MPTLHEYNDEQYDNLIELTPREDQFRNYMKDMHNSLSTFIDLIKCPKNEDEYNERVNLLNQLIDIVGEDESHPYVEYLHLLGAVVSQYEKIHHPTESDMYDSACATAFQHLITTCGLTEFQWGIIPVGLERVIFNHTGEGK